MSLAYLMQTNQPLWQGLVLSVYINLIAPVRVASGAWD